MGCGRTCDGQSRFGEIIMAQKEKVVTARVKKPKTAAQRAKTEANIKAAAERLARLQAQQKMVNAVRATGVVGSDTTIMRLVCEADRKTEEQKSKQFVDSVLSGPYADRVRKFMGAGLAGNPCKVALVIRNYLKTQGFKEAV